MHTGEQDHDFLDGGLGSAYYQYRLATIRQALQRAGALVFEDASKAHRIGQQMTVDERAATLGAALTLFCCLRRCHLGTLFLGSRPTVLGSRWRLRSALLP